MTTEPNYLRRLPQDEIVYFLIPDRFENGDEANDRGGLDSNDRQVTGFDPSDERYYHGGDLEGVRRRLAYIKALGATAILLTPVMRNKYVQMGGAAYHGYWILDFTGVDPHLGSEETFRQLVDEAHGMNLKVFLDIVVKQTADVIHYVERGGNVPYRSRSEFPVNRLHGLHGQAINEGFTGDGPGHRNQKNFGCLNNPNWAWTIHIEESEKDIKRPAILNDPLCYTLRGNSTFTGEDSIYGDFLGLNNLWLENPRVSETLTDVYKDWISRFRIDGYRIDAAKHTPACFYEPFVREILAHAKANGIPHFHLFGEVSSDTTEVSLCAQHTRDRDLPHVIDFPFALAVGGIVAGQGGTALLANVFDSDVIYKGGRKKALRMPTFVSNHDRGRIAWYIRRAFPKASDREVLQRVILAYAMMLTLRGAPMIYYGDEQGFAGVETGTDCHAREDMFPSKVAAYNAEKLVGTAATLAESNFDQNHPIFRAIRELCALRKSKAALRRGLQSVLYSSDKPGLLAVSRCDPESGEAVIVAFNTSSEPASAQIETDPAWTSFVPLHGPCETEPTVAGSYHLEIGPLDFRVIEAASCEQALCSSRGAAGGAEPRFAEMTA
jgi:glycosidase